jgi:hypothetical protein
MPSFNQPRRVDVMADTFRGLQVVAVGAAISSVSGLALLFSDR